MPVPTTLLRSISSGCDRIPALYFQGNPLLRYVFWGRLRTIFRHVIDSGVRRDRCLDFCGGGGVFLPTLSSAFREVTLVDLLTTEAGRLLAALDLRNVTILQEDVREGDLGSFDVVVAADVLEHFLDLRPPLAALRRCVGDDGLLVTSLPTENFIYRALRWLFRVEKPDDHYHTAYEVERHLEAAGFRRVWTTRLPNPLSPLFLITSWRKQEPASGKLEAVDALL